MLFLALFLQGDWKWEHQQDVFAQSGHSFWPHVASALWKRQQNLKQLTANLHERQLVSRGHGSGKTCVRISMSKTATFGVIVRVWSPSLCVRRCKSFSTSFSWRAFQHLTANVKAFSSLLKYNRNVMHLYVHKFSAQRQNVSCLMWWMLLSSHGWLVYSEDASFSHQVEPSGRCEKTRKQPPWPKPFLFEMWWACVFCLLTSLPAVSK